MATYKCILGHDHLMCKEANENSEKSIELFRKAVEWYETNMDINEATDLYEQSALLGNKAAENNFFIIIDASSYHTKIDSNTRYGKMQDEFRPEEYFSKHGPNKFTEMVLCRIYLNRPMMFHTIFMDNKEIYDKYEEWIIKSQIYGLVLNDIETDYFYIKTKINEKETENITRTKDIYKNVISENK